MLNSPAAFLYYSLICLSMHIWMQPQELANRDPLWELFISWSSSEQGSTELTAPHYLFGKAAFLGSFIADRWWHFTATAHWLGLNPTWKQHLQLHSLPFWPCNCVPPIFLQRETEKEVSELMWAGQNSKLRTHRGAECVWGRHCCGWNKPLWVMASQNNPGWEGIFTRDHHFFKKKKLVMGFFGCCF